jgi:hypothetical protein
VPDRSAVRLLDLVIVDVAELLTPRCTDFTPA